FYFSGTQTAINGGGSQNAEEVVEEVTEEWVSPQNTESVTEEVVFPITDETTPDVIKQDR
ncbi:MAG: hypothetical protein AB4058_18210, partial [Microcystaceae cyanobacterium]